MDQKSLPMATIGASCFYSRESEREIYRKKVLERERGVDGYEDWSRRTLVHDVAAFVFILCESQHLNVVV